MSLFTVPWGLGGKRIQNVNDLTHRESMWWFVLGLEIKNLLGQEIKTRGKKIKTVVGIFHQS